MKKSMTALASLMLVGLMSVPALAVNCPVGDSDGPMVIAPAPTTGYQQTIQVDGQKTDLSPQAEKVVPFRPQKQTWRRWASLAACLVVVMAAVLAFASAAIVQTIPAIAVLKGEPLEAVIDFGVVFHSALLTVPSSLG